MHRLCVVALAGLAALAGAAAAEEVEDPTGRACASPNGDAECTELVVSGTGNATCRTTTCTAVAVTGNASSCYADDRVAHTGCLAASGTGEAVADGGAASGTGDSRSDVLAASGTGNATSTGFAVSGTGDASGSTALAGRGQATGPVALHPDTARHAADDTARIHRDRDPGAATGWPPLAEATIRPGVRVADRTCTANFVFSDPSNETLYVATAAHCLDDHDVGETVGVAGGRHEGVVAYVGTRTVEGVEEGPCARPVAQDFGLVRIPDRLRDEVHPATLHWGGPRGISARARSGEDLHTYGNSTTRAHEVLRPAEGLSVGNDVCFTDAAFPERIGGDSGSPVLGAEGAALGVHVRSDVVDTATFVNVHQAVGFAETHTDLELELKTWPAFDEAPVLDPLTPPPGPPSLPGS